MSVNAAIEVRGLSVRFGAQRVFDSLDLRVAEGSVTALVGRNGCGKSTLLRVLAGELVRNGGEARVLGLDPTRHGAKVRELIGYVPERTEIAPRIRVGEWLEFVAQFHPTWSCEEEVRLLELFELDRSRRIRELSKGNREKLALVVALAHRPKLVLLDEPFSGLDVGVRDAIAKSVVGHLRDEDRSVLLVSHSIEDVERLADRVAILDGGRIVREGELEELAHTEDGGLDLERLLRELPSLVEKKTEVLR